MPFPFRTPASQDNEEEWKPPDYAVPVKASSSEEWTPPSYATPVKKEKKEGPSALSKAIEALKPAKSIKPTGSLLPSFLKPSTEPIPYESDEEKAAKPKPEEKGLFSRAVESASKFLSEHPKIREAGQRFLTGTSPEFEAEMKKRGVSEIQGPGVMSIPGVKQATDYLSQKVAGSEGNTRLAAGAVIQALGGILEGGFDPRTAGIKASVGELPIRQSREIPYKMETSPKVELPQTRPDKLKDFMKKNPEATMADIEEFTKSVAKVKPPEVSTVTPTETPEELKPKVAVPRTEEEQSALRQQAHKNAGIIDKTPRRTGEMSTDELYQIQDLPGRVKGIQRDERTNIDLLKESIKKEGVKEPIILKKSPIEDTYSIEDGHHRLAAAKELGLETVPVKIGAKGSRSLEITGGEYEPKKPFVSPFEKKAEKPIEQTFGEFGGVGHPDEPGYTDKVLKRAGSGEPGLAVEPVEGLDNVNHVVYRNRDGEPIAAAMVVKDQSGKTLVQDLAADKSKGLLTGRAMKALGGKLEELGATEAAGTVSPDAQNFIAKMKERAAKPAKEIESLSEWKPPEYAKPVEKEPELVTVGGSGESAASQEAINRQSSMKSKGEQYVVYDRAGNARPLIGPEAVDYQPRPGETFGIITQKRGFRVLEDRGGNFRKSGPAEFVRSEEGGMRWEGPIPGGGEPFSGRPESRTLNKLFNALEDAKENVGAQEALNRQERARRFAAFSGVKEEGAAGAAKSLGKLKGEFAKVQSEALGLNQKESDSLFTAVKEANITAGEKARGYTALFKLMNGEGTPVRSELKILDDVFGNGFADKVTELHGGLGLIGLKVSKLASTMKSMQNALSLAAPLRHGIGLVYKKEFYPAFKDMFKFFGNKEFYNTSMKALEERPNYLLGRDSGLFLAKPGSLQSAEEEFLNSYVGALPGIRNVVGASQRAYTGFLNKLRADVFDSMTKQAEGLGAKMSVGAGDSVEATREARAIAKFINNATGRGDLGSLNKITNELNVMFWSPRMIASRVNILANPKIYMDLPKGMRLEGLKSLLGIAALGTTIDTLAAYGGAKISSNILSTDFGKSRFGTKLIDPWGGFQQYVVFAARFLAGKTDSQHPQTRLDIGERFIANKLSPVASLARNILTAKPGSQGKEGPGSFTTQYGQPTSIQREVAKTFTPIFIQDLQTLAQSEPDWSENVGLTAAMAGASLTGMAQEYPEKQKGKLQFRKMKLKP